MVTASERAANQLRFAGRLLAMVSCSLTLAGCTGTYGPVYSASRSYEDLSIAASRATVKILDARESVESVEFQVPAFTMPGQGESSSPPLASHFDLLLQAKVGTLLEGEGPALVFEVTVNEAEVGWSSAAFSESEFASVKLTVRVTQESSKVLLVEGNGESWGRYKSMDTNKWAPKAMLEDTFVDAFEAFLADAEMITKLNGACRDLETTLP